MKHRSSTCRMQWLATVLVTALTAPAIAQTDDGISDMEEMRRSIEVFAGVLRDSLDLNIRQSIFHPRAGDVRGRYLSGQGVVLEVGTPLQARRGALGRYAMQQSVSDLADQIEDMGGTRRMMVRRPDTDAMREVLALSLRRDQAAVVYREMMEQLAEVDGYVTVDNALRAAGEAARFLRNAGELTDEAFQQQTEELGRLRSALAERVAEREALQRSLRQSSAEGSDDPGIEAREQWQASLERLQSGMAELRQLAVRQADELRARSESLRADQLSAWRDEVTTFEQTLFAVVCDYGASLRALPDDEHLSLVLTGLGEDGVSGIRTDRIHVMTKEALLQCQRGLISAEELMALAHSYDM